MENFKEFYFESEENVSMESFNEKIAEAFKFLKEKNNLSDNAIKQIRHSCNLGYLVKGKSFLGQYLSFEISKDGEVTRHLHCFIDNQKKYMELMAN